MKKLSSSIGNDLRLGLPHGQEVLSSSTPAHHSFTRFVNSPLLSVFLLLTMSFIVAGCMELRPRDVRPPFPATIGHSIPTPFSFPTQPMTAAAARRRRNACGTA